MQHDSHLEGSYGSNANDSRRCAYLESTVKPPPLVFINSIVVQDHLNMMSSSIIAREVLNFA